MATLSMKGLINCKEAVLKWLAARDLIYNESNWNQLKSQLKRMCGFLRSHISEFVWPKNCLNGCDSFSCIVLCIGEQYPL